MNPPNFSLLFFRKSYHFALWTLAVHPPFFSYHSRHHPLFALSYHPSLHLSLTPASISFPQNYSIRDFTKPSPSTNTQPRRRYWPPVLLPFISKSCPYLTRKRGSHPHTSTQKDIARTRFCPKRPFLYSTRRRVKSLAHSVIESIIVWPSNSQAP